MAKDLILDSEEFRYVIKKLATATKLLVSSDFDGTIAPFTIDPGDSAIIPEVKVALRKLSEQINTVVAVVSGRALHDLTTKLSQINNIRLIGSHGHEFDLDHVYLLSPEKEQLLLKATCILKLYSEMIEGLKIESKPHGVVLHYRGVIGIPTLFIDSIKKELYQLGDGLIRDGNQVIEFSVVKTHKGNALEKLQTQYTPNCTLFLGDDVTDESVFEVMRSSDISIKVGPGETAAQYRLRDTHEVTKFLAVLSEKRSEWLNSLPNIPIENHYFISDQRTMALLDNSGTISWLCAPKLDSSPLFGSLVGGPSSGYFRIYTDNDFGKAEYIEDTLIGKLDFGNITVIDFLDCSKGRTYQRAGRSDLVRIIEGTGIIKIIFSPKFNFGKVNTKIYKIPNGLQLECGQQRSILYSPGIDWNITQDGIHDVASAAYSLQNQKIYLKLLIGTATDSLEEEDIEQLIDENISFWQSWVSNLDLPIAQKDLVARSAIVLRGLCYGPTGAIAAAATTSLPETIGAGRNWDYRFCWPRDASLAASALVRLNSTGHAMRLLDWLLQLTLDEDSDADNFLAPLYTVTGRAVQGEAEIPEAVGYRGSRPVRVGNLAADQLQLDSLGPIAELMLRLSQRGASLTEEHYQLANRLVGLVSSRWKDKDNGIWEVRTVQRHFVHSKLMCWYTVDCCYKVAKYLGISREDWSRLADEIRKDIEEYGYNEDLGSYVAAYDLIAADAALIWIVLTGFHPPDHIRSIGTIQYIKSRLYHNKSLYRYHFDDALLGQEGEFIICRTWLIEALQMIGNTDEAKMLLDELLSRLNDIGLLAEQWDPLHETALGNYPQAYSHLGLINAICSMEGK